MILENFALTAIPSFTEVGGDFHVDPQIKSVSMPKLIMSGQRGPYAQHRQHVHRREGFERQERRVQDAAHKPGVHRGGREDRPEQESLIGWKQIKKGVVLEIKD